MKLPEDCSLCRFWRSAGAGDGSGECRRRAPAIYADDDDKPPRFYNGWPATYANEWCGEYER